MMKAVICRKYGPPEVLELREVERPVPRDNEILIRIYATSVTAGDCEFRRFKFPVLFWLPLRIYMGFTKPRRPILGMELAGEVAAVGKDVAAFKPGDRVLAATGIGFGAYAEYVCLPDTCAMALKPAAVSYEEAAVLPIGGLNALHFLRKANIRPGQKVLVYGASGSIGTFAVQLARHFGAQVSGLCSTANIDLVKALGAHDVIDYTREDFSGRGESYDVIFDTVGKSSFSRCMKVLKPDGYYLLASPGLPQLLQKRRVASKSRQKVITEAAGESSKDLAFLATLLQQAHIRSVIDRCYPVERICEAHGYVETGRKKGNVAVTLVGNQQADGA